MKLFVTSPTTGLVDIHYMRSIFELQAQCHKRKCHIQLHIIFIDTDSQFDAKDIFRMIDADKEVILIPYPLKYYDWKKADEMYMNHKIPVNKGGFVWPIKVSNPEDMIVDNGIVEIERGPAGCMVIKRSAYER